MQQKEIEFDERTEKWQLVFVFISKTANCMKVGASETKTWKSAYKTQQSSTLSSSFFPNRSSGGHYKKQQQDYNLHQYASFSSSSSCQNNSCSFATSSQAWKWRNEKSKKEEFDLVQAVNAQYHNLNCYKKGKSHLRFADIVLSFPELLFLPLPTFSSPFIFSLFYNKEWIKLLLFHAFTLFFSVSLFWQYAFSWLYYHHYSFYRY